MDNVKYGKRSIIKPFIILLLLLVTLLFLFLIAISFGSVSFTLKEVINTILGNGSDLSTNIIQNIRVPRAIINIIVGCNLAISGVLLQAVMRNPLADPGVIGVSSGASFIAVVIMLLFPNMFSSLPFFAFIGASFACFLVYILSWKNGLDPIRIILSGVAINSILGSGVSLLSILYSDKIQNVLLWLNGSMSGKTYRHVETLLPYSIIGIILSLLCINQANVLQLGDSMAKNLGYNPNKSRFLISLVASFLAGITVSIVGIVGFVGLIVPHIVRYIVGSDYKYLLPCSGICGSMTIIIADTFGRTVFAPLEIPVGIIMSTIGGPFFLWLLRKRS